MSDIVAWLEQKETVKTLTLEDSWDEEDEKTLRSVIDSLRKYQKCRPLVSDAVEDEIEWLVSLSPNKKRHIENRQDQWEPSKKQMEELKALLLYNVGAYDYDKFQIVKGLYDQLMEHFEHNKQK